jgi:hypothetical protein
MSQLRRAIALTLVGTAFSGCLGFIEPDYLLPAKRLEKVRDLADTYSQFLRFGRIPEAAAFVRREDRKAFLDAFMDVARRVQFTNTEVVNAESTDSMTVEVWTRYELFELPSIQVRSLSEKQVWHFDPVGRTWQVQPDLSVFPGARSPAGATPAAS